MYFKGRKAVSYAVNTDSISVIGTKCRRSLNGWAAACEAEGWWVRVSPPVPDFVGHVDPSGFEPVDG